MIVKFITQEMLQKINLACLDKTVKNQKEAFKKHIPELTFSQIDRIIRKYKIKVPKEVCEARRSLEEVRKERIRRAKEHAKTHESPNKGRKLTQEEKDNISKKNKGRKRDEAFREKCRLRMEGFIQSDEAKMKIALSNSTRTISNSFRELASSNTKRLWQEGVFKKRTIEYVSKRFGRFLLKSSYELKFLMDAESDASIETIEYEVLECEYIDENGIKRLTSGDFLINKTTLKEIKTDTLWQNKERSLLKINAMEEHCKKLNIKYDLVTERDLGLLDSEGKFKKKEYDELNALAKSLLLINKEKIKEKILESYSPLELPSMHFDTKTERLIIYDKKAECK